MRRAAKAQATRPLPLTRYQEAPGSDEPYSERPGQLSDNCVRDVMTWNRMKALVKSRSKRGSWLEEIAEPAIGIYDVLIRVAKALHPAIKRILTSDATRY
jgi:hypothetical protein